MKTLKLASTTKKINQFLASAFLLVIFSNLSIAQNKDFGDITLEMLEKEHSEIDSLAAAEVLNEKGEISFSITNSGWIYSFEVTRRIKIFNKDGYDEANIEIPFYVGESTSYSERVKRIDARTYYLEDGKVKDDKIRKKDIFDVELNEYASAKKFTFPSIQDGVIIEFTYTVESPNIRNLPRWGFQSSIPTKSSVFELYIPTEYLTYRSQTRGYNKIETKDENLNGRVGGVTNTNFTITHKVHEAKNLEAVEGENHVNNISNYLTALSYELSSYRKGDVGDVKYFATTWEDVEESLRESETFSKELERGKYFEEDLDAYLEGTTDEIELVHQILNFVKNKVEWNEESRRFCSDNLKKVYEEGSGNSADLNIMLTAMLRYKGIDAHPVVCSTIGNGIPFFPTVTGFNYIISGVTVGENYFLLDATDKYSSLNLIPTRTMNWQGIEISPNGSRTIPLIPNQQSKASFNVMASLTEDGKVEGQFRAYYFDQFALNARNAFTETSEDKVKSTYEEEFEISDVHDFTQNNLSALNKPLVQSFKFGESEGFVEKIANKIYISPLLFLKSDENPFKRKTREYPVEFTYPKKYTYRIMINLPENYEVDYTPENNIYKMADGLLQFTYVLNVDSGKLILDVTKEIAVPTVTPELYPDLRDYYISMQEKEDEKIVLVKS